MSRFVTADERDPLIQIDWAEHGMRMHDVAERETVGVANGVAERVTGALERRPRRVGVELPGRKCRLRCGDAPRAIENTIHIDGADDW